MLCETPHYEGHAEECGCKTCHKFHDWREWNIYPECKFCVAEMRQFWQEKLREAA